MSINWLLMPRPVASAAPIVPPITPLLAVVADEHREAGRGVEASHRRFAVDFPEHALELAVQRGAADGRGRGRRLRRERREAVEQRRDVVERAVLDLQRRQAVVRVADALVEDRDVRAVGVGDREAGRVVARAVDAEAARQTGQGLLQAQVGAGEVGVALADAMLLTTENEAISHSSLKLRPASLPTAGGACANRVQGGNREPPSVL